MNSEGGPGQPAGNSFQQWLAQGEQLYALLMKQHQTLEAQLLEMESRLADKQTEVQQLARILGKSPPDLGRRISAQLVTHYAPDIPAPGTQSPRPAVSRPLPGRVGPPPRTGPPARAPG